MCVVKRFDLEVLIDPYVGIILNKSQLFDVECKWCSLM